MIIRVDLERPTLSLSVPQSTEDNFCNRKTVLNRGPTVVQSHLSCLNRYFFNQVPNCPNSQHRVPNPSNHCYSSCSSPARQLSFAENAEKAQRTKCTLRCSTGYCASFQGKISSRAEIWQPPFLSETTQQLNYKIHTPDREIQGIQSFSEDLLAKLQCVTGVPSCLLIGVMAYGSSEGNYYKDSCLVFLGYFKVCVSQFLNNFYDHYTSCLFSHEIARRHLVILQDNFSQVLI